MKHMIEDTGLEGLELSEVGMKLPEDITQHQHYLIGLELAKLEKGLQWAIGDWFDAIKWGKKADICKVVGINYGTANNCAVVCREFQITRRRAKLTFTHHREVVSLERSEQERLLDWSVKKKIGVTTLRNEVKALQAKKVEGARLPPNIGAPPPAPPPPDVSFEPSAMDHMPTDEEAAQHAADLGIDLDADKPIYSKQQLDAEVLNALSAEILKQSQDADAEKRIAKALNRQHKRVMKFVENLEPQVKARVFKESYRTVKQRWQELYEYERVLKKESERVIKCQSTVDCFMSREEFRLVLSCLHPDKQPEERRDRYNKAFDIIKRMEKEVSPQTPIEVLRMRGWESIKE